MTEREVFEMYRKDVYRTCYFMLQHGSDAEDVCQEVFMNVFRHEWRKVEHLKTWLMRVTVNHCLNHLKKLGREKEKKIRWIQGGEQIPEKAADDILAEKESAIECAYLLDSLPVKLRAVVSLRYLNECSLNEIADIMRIPLGTVKSRMNKGLLQMRRMIEKQEANSRQGGGSYGQDRTNLFSVFKR